MSDIIHDPNRPSRYRSRLTGSPERDREALLEIVRDLPRSDLFDASRAPDPRDWLRTRIRNLRDHPLPQLNDGHRLPGREGQTKPAAVLIPIVDRPSGLTLLLTQRSASLPDHPGQISFPGGRQDPEDADSAATALRESQEEVGLDPGRVDILGVVGGYETVSGYAVTPVVGWVAPPFELVPDPVEVDEAFEVPLDFVLDPANYTQGHREVNGRKRTYFVCEYGSRYIWGATAAMLLVFAYGVSLPLEG